ncbi:DUF1707 SHOCT-like domain-containing protein [Rhodococcus opacus]|uniref:DUF1707 SHOCT-like domain-containing protein n=1 Tax=Rhodococcus opacus TaxID=37919 RepID=UPI001C4530C3|nr:DUF1707 domain-containing protein [Rhodococcus opacus]MBV6761434.1 DUF1707 domain-containing protein [Rhodococcus opacus]
MAEPWLRASDTDRSRVVLALEREVGTGRLTLDEYSDRVAAAYGARTLGELAAVTRDLPAPTAAVSPASSAVSKAIVPVLVALAVLLVVFAGSPAASAMTAMLGGAGCG